MSEVYALVTGGGTGGHVSPALAIAGELLSRGIERSAIRFVGSRRGLEAEVVPAAGFEIDLLPGRGLQRRFAIANVGAILGSVAAFVRAWRIIGRSRPRVVVGVGGYASLPCVVAARFRGVPVVVHEQNAAPGLANRIAVRLGARPVVSLPGTSLGGAEVVGNPVQGAIADLERAPTRERPLVFVFGGSLGSQRINRAVLGLAERWRERPVHIRHVSGRREFAQCQTVLERVQRPSDVLRYELVEYEQRMEEWYARAWLAVCRAGAITIAELAAAGVPAILVPLPGAPADHQVHNAMTLVEAGAAVLLPDDECETERLGREIEALLEAPDRLDAMGRAALALAQPDAAAHIVDVVLEVAGD